MGAFQPALVHGLLDQIQGVRGDRSLFFLTCGVSDSNENPASRRVTRSIVLRE